jgi:hypothetical protein
MPVRRLPAAAVGVTVKSGWASVVLLGGSAAAPLVLDSRRIDLSDPALPESRQPYHAGFATARPDGPELTRLLMSVKRFGGRAMAGIAREYRSAGYRLAGMGIVVGSLIDPTRIGNDHIRIHALEGRFFRGVVESAAVRSKLAHFTWRERDLRISASEGLERPEARLKFTLTELGKGIDGPWRAEEKSAALAAWLTLACHGSPRTDRNRSGT